jgi:serine protease Do
MFKNRRAVIAAVSVASLAPVIGACGVVGAGDPGKGDGSEPSGRATASQPANPAKLTARELIAKLSPSVVNVITSDGGGTGVVIDADRGLILTNDHVVAGQDSLKVSLDRGQPLPVRVVGRAACDDLAVLQFVNEKPAGLRAAALGRSSAVQLGDHVTAFGFPPSLDSYGTDKEIALQVTDGKVSAVKVAGQPGADIPTLVDTIQHQAPINAGNSGGPLVNDRGEVVGINTIGGGEGSDGQGWAISSDHVRALLDRLTSGHDVATIGMDLTPASDLDWSDDPGMLGALEERGLDHKLLVVHVDAALPAGRGGVEAGDMLLRVNGRDVDTVSDVCDIVQSARPGDRVRLEGTMVYSGPFNRTWTHHADIAKA